MASGDPSLLVRSNGGNATYSLTLTTQWYETYFLTWTSNLTEVQFFDALKDNTAVTWTPFSLNPTMIPKNDLFNNRVRAEGVSVLSTVP